MGRPEQETSKKEEDTGMLRVTEILMSFLSTTTMGFVADSVESIP